MAADVYPSPAVLLDTGAPYWRVPGKVAGGRVKLERVGLPETSGDGDAGRREERP
jgi:hypothetical protein